MYYVGSSGIDFFWLTSESGLLSKLPEVNLLPCPFFNDLLNILEGAQYIKHDLFAYGESIVIIFVYLFVFYSAGYSVYMV